ASLPASGVYDLVPRVNGREAELKLLPQEAIDFLIAEFLQVVPGIPIPLVQVVRLKHGTEQRRSIDHPGRPCGTGVLRLDARQALERSKPVRPEQFDDRLERVEFVDLGYAHVDLRSRIPQPRAMDEPHGTAGA